MIVFLAGFSSSVQDMASFPNKLRLFAGQFKQVQLSIPVQAELTVDPEKLTVNDETVSSTVLASAKTIKLQSNVSGPTEMKVKLFGKIPYRTVKVDVIPDLRVVPGGQTIGVKVNSAGVLIVGQHQVKLTSSEQKVSPGEEAGLKLGDLIVGLNKEKIENVRQLAELCNKYSTANKPLLITFIRNGRTLQTKLQPIYDEEDQSWRMGLYIRDSAVGVGTLTFYAPDQGVYGALGHIIADMDTGTPITVGRGEIVQSSVTSINKSETGDPGEKRAHFVKDNIKLGNIERNTSFGIFGKMTQMPTHAFNESAIPVAFAEDVKEGPAQILTVINGQEVEKFDIEVVHVARQSEPATKGLVIKIVDDRLIKQTGGIVQGMSGSPIIQDGKLIGAVTHVFVNDPTSGYGCFIEWMLQDAGVLLNKELEKAL